MIGYLCTYRSASGVNISAAAEQIGAWTTTFTAVLLASRGMIWSWQRKGREGVVGKEDVSDEFQVE